ncbi:hypothetical protein Y032_0273g998 [Ancylostoma ceylanicum]|uniref:EGF-like domain-containing protein n=1 Tax=Ancylostoma ceylanicum TaxID=53326 RepID=A0A016S830_9BILA|nr:hypothetical protein Y032_0273g998 [Ancylostoma ceylanicum]
MQVLHIRIRIPSLIIVCFQEKCKNVRSANCTHGGFPHPRECSKCICPSGYGGPLCNQRPPDNCGKELSASTEWKPLTDMMMYVNAEDFIDGYDKCNYWIKSANNTFIAVKIKSLRPAGPVRNGCVEAGVEIKAQKNQVLTGYRFCFQEHEGLILTSYTNLVPVIFYSRSTTGISMITLEYRQVSARPSE